VCVCLRLQPASTMKQPQHQRVHVRARVLLLLVICAFFVEQANALSHAPVQQHRKRNGVSFRFASSSPKQVSDSKHASLTPKQTTTSENDSDTDVSASVSASSKGSKAPDKDPATQVEEEGSAVASPSAASEADPPVEQLEKISAALSNTKAMPPSVAKLIEQLTADNFDADKMTREVVKLGQEDNKANNINPDIMPFSTTLKETRGSLASASSSTNVAPPHSAAEAMRLLETMASSFYSTNQASKLLQELFTKEDVLQALKSPPRKVKMIWHVYYARPVNGFTSVADLPENAIFAMEYANAKYLNSGTRPDLTSVLQEFAGYRPALVSKGVAASLDGVDTLSPIEEMAMNHTNRQRKIKGSQTDLEINYKALIQAYVDDSESGAAADARELYKAMAGWGTKEAELFRILENKSQDEIKAISIEFDKILAENGKSVKPGCKAGKRPRRCKRYSSMLEQWLHEELSGGDLKKAMHMYTSKKVEKDEHYYWDTRIAAKWNRQLKSISSYWTDQAENGSGIGKVFGKLSTGFFKTITGINKGINNAMKSWKNKYKTATSTGGKVMAGLGVAVSFVTAALAAPLKALDPAATIEDTKNGIMEWVIILGTLGAGKLLAAAAATAKGGMLVAKIGRQMRRLKMFALGTTHYMRIGKSAAHYTRSATKYRTLATEAVKRGDAAQAELCKKIAMSLDNIAKQTTKTDDLIKAAFKKKKAAETAVSGSATASTRTLGAVTDAAGGLKRAQFNVMKQQTMRARVALLENQIRRTHRWPVVGPIVAAGAVVGRAAAIKVVSTARDEAAVQFVKSEADEGTRRLDAQIRMKKHKFKTRALHAGGKLKESLPFVAPDRADEFGIWTVTSANVAGEDDRMEKIYIRLNDKDEYEWSLDKDNYQPVSVHTQRLGLESGRKPNWQLIKNLRQLQTQQRMVKAATTQIDTSAYELVSKRVNSERINGKGGSTFYRDSSSDNSLNLHHYDKVEIKHNPNRVIPHTNTMMS
jgi:Annexin